MILHSTLSKISNWSPYIFTLVLKVRFGASINQPLCRSFHLKMTGTSCRDDARVKVPSFQKVTFFLQYYIFQRDAVHLYFCLFEDVSDCRDLR